MRALRMVVRREGLRVRLFQFLKMVRTSVYGG